MGSFNLTQDGVSFNMVSEISMAASMLPFGPKMYEDAEEQATSKKLINCVDIDWNSAELGTVNGINLGTINTTGELLQVIKLLASKIPQQEEPTKYTVQFSNDGGSVSAPSILQVTEGAQITLPDYTGSKSGYQSPTKWIDMNTQTAYNFGATYTVTQNTIFKVQWVPSKSDPTITVYDLGNITIADGSSATIMVQSNVSGKLTLSPSSGIGWSASSSSSSTASTSHIVTINNLNTVPTSGTISANTIKGTFTPTNTTNYNIKSNIIINSQTITLQESQEETIYYFGTTLPTTSNYQTLTPRYSSSSEVYGKTVNVTGGNYIYYLCPSSHALTTEQRKSAMLDSGGTIIKFSTTIDTTSINDYTIYQQLIDNTDILKFNINY